MQTYQKAALTMPKGSTKMNVEELNQKSVPWRRGYKFVTDGNRDLFKAYPDDSQESRDFEAGMKFAADEKAEAEAELSESAGEPL